MTALPRHGQAWPGHPRLVTGGSRKDVDARLKAGHDDGGHGEPGRSALVDGSYPG
jgi:hypothetical protein